MDLFKILGFKKEDSVRSHGELFRRLSPLLTGYSDDQVKLICGVSGLLGTVAFSDHEVCEKERIVLNEAIVSFSKLDEETARKIEEVVAKLSSDLAFVEDHHYTRLVNEVAGLDSKQEIIKLLFKLAAASQDISDVEEHKIGLISDQLCIPRELYIVARSEFSEQLSFLN